MKKKILALLLALCMVIGMLPATAMAANTFTASNSWSDGLFTDVKQGDWFYENVKGAYELGLMVGCGDGTFEPYGRITLAQTVAVAARLHAVSTTGKDEFVQGDTWYRVYVDYALANGILDEELADYNQEATRLEFAHILVRALPAEDLQAINDVKYGEIPDVASDEAVYTLYRAGILNGKGNGQFGADDIIDRCQMAAIVTRMALPELRVKVEKESGIPSTGGNLWWPDFDWGNDDEVQPSPSPAPEEDVKVTVSVESENGAVKNEVSMESDSGVKATVPAGVTLTEGAKELTLTVDAMESTGSDVTAGEDEEMTSYDVHIEGVAEDNTVVITVALGAVLPKGLNMGNVELYHVEDGATNAMQQVLTLSELDAHNEFYYDPATGEVTVALVSFSEITVVNEEAKWEGEFDYTWYDASKTELTIANADQLAAFGAIVGGMADGIEQDSFKDKTVKLIADVNLGDAEESNDPDLIFYPIGYNSDDGKYEKTGVAVSTGFYSFMGTFDGNGHTIANFYQNTWEMKGDHNWYDATLQYYRDGMGLFGKVYGGTVKNLTVENFSSDGEITTTGVIAAYADGATFENIAIFNCNPRVYNIGNGGIVGCVGWYAKEAGLQTTFKNITVDNSNKISALWGSYDVACGGIVGQYYPTSGQTSAGTPKNAGVHFENCHVAAQMDVYNDVCANYQYYAYRYTGMLIGSVRENVKGDDGHVYPKMDGITAEGCTVHFGDWNDYYYCELVANTTASYTHDHQMSRLEQVEGVNVDTKKYLPLGAEDVAENWVAIPTSGRCNYVVVNETNEDGTFNHATANATCYHFVDGAVWNHADAGTETVNGVEGVLKEDKQHIYLEFNNLVTGYGWGVTSKGVDDLAGVTILDREEGNSVEKFESTVTELANNKEYKIGDIFAEKENNSVAIVPGALTVTVTNKDTVNNPVSATVVYDEENWENGTLTLKGTGDITITIQDYYFCTPTTITVTVSDRQSEEKFDVVMNNGDFLHRVGNANTVALGKLFKAKDGVTVGTVSATVEALNGTAASGTYNSNATWTSGTIQFSGTGVVKVTITDNDYCIPTELILEVVDAKNITKAESATANNVVLLNDISGTFSVTNGYTFYGNGFTVTLPTSSVTNKGNGFVGYIGLGAAADGEDGSGGNLDNVRIVGPVYPETYIYRTQAEITNSSDSDYGDGYNMRYFHNSVIIYGGNCTISNSYVSGSRAAIYVKGAGKVTIDNTTVSGGSYANIEVAAAVPVTLKNLTTIQKEVADSYGQDKSMIGMGVVVSHSEAVVTIEGELNQYNWVTETQWDAMIPDAYASQFPDLFGNSYTNYQHTYDGETYVNLALIFACNWDPDTQIVDNRTNTELTYTKTNVSIAGTSGGVYSITGATLSDELYNAPAYSATTQGVFKPKVTFDYTTKNNEPEQSGSNDYCYYNATDKKYVISFDEGDTKGWYYDILTVSKGTSTLPYSVTVSGNAVVNSDNTVTFSAAGDYTVTYTYTDTLNYALSNGEIISYSVSYEQHIYVTVYVVEPEADPSTFAFGSNGYKSITAGGVTYVMPNVTTTANPTKSDNVVTASGIGSKTVDGETIYYPIIGMHKVGSKYTGYYNYFSVFEAVTITDANGTSVYNTSTTEIPSNLTVIGGFIDNGTESANGTAIFNYSTGKTIKTKSNVTVKGTNVGLCYYPDSSFTSGTTARDEQTIVVKYCYTDTNGKAYYYYIGYWCAQGSNGVQSSDECVSADTLVTLADGTQKEIQYVTYEDELLVWDFFNGEYAVVPSAIIFNHGYGNYRVLALEFEDGTVIKVINNHGFFNTEENKFVLIDEENVESYIGHSFVKTNGDKYANVKLIGYSVNEEYTGCYSIQTAQHNNFIVEGMFSITKPEYEGWFDYFEIGEGMKYDEEKMQADIEKYGLYTYEDFAEYVTYEQFIAFNGPYLKVLVGKGVVTYEQIIELIATYVNP